MSIEWPLASVNISQGYGPGHHGIDLAAPAGTPIYATDAGVVEANGWGQNHSWMLSPAGIFVLLRHSWGYSGYAHMTSFAVNVGQPVARGQLIGYVGATGTATGPHVHFEIFPPSPNWSNGYSGRISPYTHTIVPHSTAPTTPAPPVTPTELKEEEPLTYHVRPQTNSSQDKNGVSRIWAGDGRVLNGISYSGVWVVGDDNARRLTTGEWDFRKAAAATDGKTIKEYYIHPNVLEQIIYTVRF
ncbi:M23 family metallopeptidase [Lysinibacter cavernae]|uniref:M23ase beta-sheet core domain-containing protein n=1 Tax=Lysinibacter cavernae TaxID=1640652 RepID=A0A7X5R224_9MICO|nr:M23 family metallopeptidase [Lysinibacter cavernae]NIH54243.1 hypothetical protein [Lysinibacter cavernae]